MIVKLLAEHHLEFLSLKGGCIGSCESTLVKITHCWKSHVTAHLRFRLPSIGCVTSANTYQVQTVFLLFLAHPRLSSVNQ